MFCVSFELKHHLVDVIQLQGTPACVIIEVLLPRKNEGTFSSLLSSIYKKKAYLT